jgi:microcin C transport system permease protein
MALSPLNQRRWNTFRRNKRAYWSMWIFAVLFGLSLFAEFLANDKPILVSYRGEIYTPIFKFYPETSFGGDFRTEAIYRDPEVQCLIRSGGVEDCFDEPEEILEQIRAETFDHAEFHKGWSLWPLIPYSFNTTVDRPGAAPLPPNRQNLLGTDDTKRDVLARVIHGFRLSILFTLMVTGAATVIGILAGAVQGYFGGWLDLVFQRVIEIWSSTPTLYVIIIMPQFLAAGGADDPVQLDLACGRGAGRIPEGAQSGVCSRGQGPGRGQYDHHAAPHAAQCHGGDADHAAVHHHRHHQRPGRAGFPWLRPTIFGTLLG